ncbi:MAG TPA: AlkA N-terminal domain-containing protein [Steroidobacteraceae bacterium]|nr:AlkA N-terminal domain-containing protein [Steroidobacteraceae bacterium]
MAIDPDICYRALRARDRRFDGRFFAAVVTTGIYCRPICPARTARRENLRFFASAAGAERQGFRPCLRCRPERAPGLAPVDAVSRLVRGAIAGIEEHALSSAGVADLAASLGVSDRHLRRVTEAELGVSPIELAQTQRLLLAKRLLRDTSLSQTDIAFASGFGSVRRFNALFKSRYGLSPSAVRGRGDISEILQCRLEYRPPFAFDALLQYLGARAIPGVEAVDATHYRRTVAIDGFQGWLAVSQAHSGHALELELSQSLAPVIGTIIARVKRLFDLGAVPDAVAALLSQDSQIEKSLRRRPGLRAPGAFDGFEIAMRAILGQQVSVRAATTISGRLVGTFGTAIETPFTELTHLSPDARRIAGINADRIAALGVVGARASALGALAQASLSGAVQLSAAADVDAQVARLRRLPGIGPWTAQYIAMRALHWPDAFPSGDLVLRRAANCSEKHLLARAEAWRPWRAYAAHHLWQSMGDSV